MYPNTELKLIKRTAKHFVEQNYKNELQFFDTFWEIFLPLINNGLSKFTDSNIITDISFAKANALDLVTPVILATVTETIHKRCNNNFSTQELEKFIGKTAAHFGASVELTASLTRGLTALCTEVFSTKQNADKSVISSVALTQYQIWTNGKCRVADDITNYEKSKKDYICWLDLDKRLSAKSELSPMSAKLLKYLIERIGSPTPAHKVLEEVFGDNRGDNLSETDRNKIEQQLTKINKFCKGKFRKYLYQRWYENGLGLEDSFKDKYLLFSRLG